jgi:hypothetical protein
MTAPPADKWFPEPGPILPNGMPLVTRYTADGSAAIGQNIALGGKGPR